MSHSDDEIEIAVDIPPRREDMRDSFIHIVRHVSQESFHHILEENANSVAVDNEDQDEKKDKQPDIVVE